MFRWWLWHSSPVPAHREEYYDPNTEDKNIAEVIVAKQRNGPLGTIKLAWLGQYTRFASLQQGGAAQ